MQYNKFFKKKPTIKSLNIDLDNKQRRQYSLCKTRGIEDKGSFELSENRYKKLISSDCFFCGEPPSKYSDGQIRNGIDRLDNKIGYTIKNSITSCSTCNFMKGKMEAHDFLNHCEKIANVMTERKLYLRTLNKNSIEYKVYMFKFGNYLSPNEIFEAIQKGLLKKEDIKYDFSIALKESPQEYDIVRNQLREKRVPKHILKKFTREFYNNHQTNVWKNADTKESLIITEQSLMIDLLK